MRMLVEVTVATLCTLLISPGLFGLYRLARGPQSDRLEKWNRAWLVITIAYFATLFSFFVVALRR